jgi:uncharacterized membrane protein YdjX (TVP38/TMEM64 family)
MTPPEAVTGATTATRPRVSRTLVLAKVGVLLALALLGILLSRVPVVREFFDRAGPTAQWLREQGAWTGPVFTAGMAVLVLLGVPRLLFCPLAGAAFGFWAGLGWTTAATMLSYYSAFLFLRGAAWWRAEPLVNWPEKLTWLRGDVGFGGVVVARLIPLPGMLTTVALSLSGVGHRSYLLGSLVGLLPEAAPLVLLGTGVIDQNLRQLLKWGAVAVLGALGAWLVAHHLHGRVRRRREGA